MSRFFTEFSGKKGFDHLPCDFDTNHPRSENENVHVVMLDPLVGRICVRAVAGPDAVDLIGGYYGPYSAATDKDAALGPALGDLFAEGSGKVRVIARLHVVSAHVDDRVAQVFDLLIDEQLKL